MFNLSCWHSDGVHVFQYSSIWNSLPEYVVHADTIDCFKNRLDKFWSNQELIYNFRAEIWGTGSRSEIVY